MVVAASEGEIIALILDQFYRRGFRDSALDLRPVLGATAYATSVRVLTYGAAARGFFYKLLMEVFIPFLIFAPPSVRNSSPGEAVIVCERRSAGETVLTLSLIEFSPSVASNAARVFCDVTEDVAKIFMMQGRLIDAGADVSPRHLDPNNPANMVKFLTLKKLARKQRRVRGERYTRARG